MSLRHVPITNDLEVWRPFSNEPWSPSHWDISTRPSFPTDRSALTPSWQTHFPMFMDRSSSSSSMMQHMDHEFRRMSDEMNRMHQQMQQMQPATLHDKRMVESFRLDNPVATQPDGSRKFRLEYDVHQFKPEEITVRTTDNHLSVHAKHEEKQDGRSVYMEYNRSYMLPKELRPDSLVSRLSKDGVLTLEAPLPALEGPKERLIPIKHS